MTDEKETQDTQENTEFFSEPTQPIEQPAQGKRKINKYSPPQTNDLKKALKEIVTAEKKTLETLRIMTRPHKKQLMNELAEIDENLRVIEEALKVNEFAAFPTVTGNSFLNITYSLLGWYEKKEQEFLLSPEWEQLQKNFPDIKEDHGTALFFCGYVNPILENLSEFKNKIADYENTKHCNLSFDDLMNVKEVNRNNRLALIEQFLDELGALDTGNRDNGATDQEHEELQRAVIKRAENIDYPLDKINSIIWGLMEKDTRGQISFNLAERGSEKKLLAYYTINFDDLGENLTITKRLLSFDKRVYLAISALFNAGNDAITLSQIYYAMGYTGRPGTKDLTRIDDSITKMTGARISFDNKQEAAAYNYVRFKYDGSLLPIERRTVIVNGKLAEAAIYVFREPPLMTFARQRKQITSVDIKLLQSPISKTDANLQIEDYLIERISQEKHSKKSGCRILFKTLFSHTGIADQPKTNTERQQKKRAPGKIEKYLKHYQKTGFISGYTMEKDGISIFFE